MCETTIISAGGSKSSGSSGAEAEALAVVGAIVLGVVVLMVMKALFVPLMTGYVLLALFGLRAPRRIIIRAIHWAWTHRNAEARARASATPAVAGCRCHQAVTGGDTPELTGAADVAAIEEQLASLVKHAERPAIRARVK